MKKHRFWVYLFWIALAEGVGALAGKIAAEGIRLYSLNAVKPPLTPPGAVFPVVWGILYLLMGIAAARVSLTPPSSARRKGIVLFMLQLTVNFFWSIIFFDLQAYDAAFFCLLFLWALVVWMTVLFAEIDKPAALLQLPYILWLTFAACLNAGVWALNG